MPQIGALLPKDHPRHDLHALLLEVARLGFAGVETGNLFREVGNEEHVRRMLADTGLALTGCHCDFAEIADPDRLAENLCFVHSLGSRYLICSGIGDRTGGLNAYREASKLFNEVGKCCQGLGVFFCYHPRIWEFADCEGKLCGMDILDQETNAEFVKYCPDIYWLCEAQIDPVRFINEHRNRAVYFHLIDSYRVTGISPSAAPMPGSTGADGIYLAALAQKPEWLLYRVGDSVSESR